MAKRAPVNAPVRMPAPDPLFNLHKAPLQSVVGSLDTGLSKADQTAVILSKKIGPLRSATEPSNR